MTNASRTDRRSPLGEQIELRRPPDHKARIFWQVIEQPPAWFGRPDANRRYQADAERLPMIAAYDGDEPVGFLSLADRTKTAAEIVVMAVAPAHHRRGVGRRLVQAAMLDCATTGRSALFVRTLGEAHPDPHYAGTRHFYRAVGFVAVEESTTEWGPDTPSLLMAKPITPARGRFKLTA